MQQFWECSSWTICTAIHASSSWLGWNCPVWRWFWSDDSEPFFSNSEPAVSNLVFVPNHQQEFIFYVVPLLMVVLIKIVGTVFGAKNADVDSFLAIFPTSKHSLRTIAGIKRRCDFKKYVCCLEHYKTYPELRHWSIYSHSKPEDFLCDHVAYPRHPHTSKRTKCGTVLLKWFNTGLSTFLCPVKVYPTIISGWFVDTGWYIATLQSVDPLNIQESTCYGRQIWWTNWKDILVINSLPFLSQPYNLGLLLNVDWFHPFQHSSYSVGVVYIVILNLPREARH